MASIQNQPACEFMYHQSQLDKTQWGEILSEVLYDFLHSTMFYHFQCGLKIGTAWIVNSQISCFDHFKGKKMVDNTKINKYLAFSYLFALFSLLVNGYSDNQHCLKKSTQYRQFIWCVLFKSKGRLLSEKFCLPF